MHEHRVARLESETVEQLQGSRAGEWKRCRFHDIERTGSVADPMRFELYVLGVGAPTGAAHRTQTPDGITENKPV